MRKKKVSILFLLIIFFAIGFSLFGQTLIMDDSELKKADLIIVLGHTPNQDGSIDNVMIARVDKGVELLNLHQANHILFTGGGEPNEAQLMAEYALKLGVPKNLIIQEQKAQSTQQNAEYSTQIMRANNLKSAIVVTSPYHMRRTSIVFSKYPFVFYFVKAQLSGDLSLLTQMKDILHEAISFIGGSY